MISVQPRPTNPVQALQNYGQSVWLDCIGRRLISSRALRESLDEVVAELEECFDMILERMRVSRISKR